MISRSVGRGLDSEELRLRSRLIDVAAQYMARGLEIDDISLRSIAADVGKAVPSIHQHFSSKTDLLVSASVRMLDDMSARLGLELVAITALDARLRRRARAYVRFAAEHPVPYRLLFMAPTADTGRSAVDVIRSSAAFRTLVDDLDRARQRGEIIDQDPTELATALWASLHGVATLLVAHPELEQPHDLLDRVLDHHLLGITPR